MSWMPQGGEVSRDHEVSQDWMNAMVSARECFILTIRNDGPTDGADEERCTDSSSWVVARWTFTLATPHATRSSLVQGLTSRVTVYLQNKLSDFCYIDLIGA